MVFGLDGIKFILTVALGDHDVAEVFGLLNLPVSYTHLTLPTIYSV